MYKVKRLYMISLITAIIGMTSLWVSAYFEIVDYNHHLVDKLTEIQDKARKDKTALGKALLKRDKLLTSLFGKKPGKDWLSMEATITWYSLSEDETDGDPDTAAHGKSRPFMVAISMRLVDALNLVPGDRIAVISDDGKIAAVVVYWDQKNPRYDDGNWIDIVAPSKAVAQRWSIRPGKIVKI